LKWIRPSPSGATARKSNNTLIRDTVMIQFRTEFFNLFNHPNFGLQDNFVGSTWFGRLVSAGSLRRIQFG
jgi:hypothetical protein